MPHVIMQMLSRLYRKEEIISSICNWHFPVSHLSYLQGYSPNLIEVSSGFIFQAILRMHADHFKHFILGMKMLFKRCGVPACRTGIFRGLPVGAP
jgi:hypothetical protein